MLISQAFFSEVLPLDCTYFSSLISTGRGGGVATIFKNDFSCRHFSLSCYASFELNVFEMNQLHPVLCAVIYRTPKYSKDFIDDFSDFFAGIMAKYYRVLIVNRDFNFHICSPSKPLVKDFLDLIDSFNLVQFVNSPTHEHGHTLDLVLSYGFPVCNIEV